MDKNVLLVDDDASILSAFEEILTEDGYSVGKAHDEKTALDELDTQEYHVAVIDLVLKDTTGIELIEKIKARSKGIPVIMITGFPSVDSSVESFRCGSFDYLVKPCDRKMLLDTIQRSLSEKEKKEWFKPASNKTSKHPSCNHAGVWFENLSQCKLRIEKLLGSVKDLTVVYKQRDADVGKKSRSVHSKLNTAIEAMDRISLSSSDAEKRELVDLAKAMGSIAKDIFKNHVFSGLNVLVADDDLSSAKLLHLNLAHLGCNVDVANNGQEATAMLKDGKQYDLVLTDIHMPLIDGLKLAEFIRREISKDMPIIAVSASVLPEEKEICFKSGMNDFVEKPLNMERLKEVMVNLIIKFR